MSLLDKELSNAGAGGSNVLLQAPSFTDESDEECVRLLRQSPSPTALLYVTLVNSPDERLNTWRTHCDEVPAAVGFVTAGEPTSMPVRSAATRRGENKSPPGPLDASIETVTESSDLTGIGIAVGKILNQWHADRRPAVCLHSLTPLLQHADLKRVFRFLHAFGGRLQRAGAITHYHLDPDAHDRQTLHTLYPLFDVIVEAGEDVDVQTSPT